ncbi:hypothetical protein BX666DRAFT_2025782 [Dichotomocladium elegans]|nr:hypothetical protein BX666DRAFT_2025782 [Dichotomocladium elegans]
MIAAPTNQTAIATKGLFPSTESQPPHPSPPFPTSEALTSILAREPAAATAIPSTRTVSDCSHVEHATSNSSGDPLSISDPIPPTYATLPQSTKLEEEPNPFERSFSSDINEEVATVYSNNGTRPILPPLAAIDSPTMHGSLFRKDELVWDSLRTGPLSPSMLTGPASAERRHQFHSLHLAQGGGQHQQRMTSCLVNQIAVAPTFKDDPSFVDRAQRASLSNQGSNVSATISVVQGQSPSSSVKRQRSIPTVENVQHDEPPTSKRRVQTNDEVDEEKRKNFLERNRQAAYKCRQRKKQWVQSLQAKAEYLTASNDELQTQAAGLREQLLQLKMQVLEHKTCSVDPHAVMEAINRPIPDIIPRSTAPDSADTTQYSLYSSQMRRF